tara:strand:+ start:63 stop:938 length:876 start_codon:yes stop_codon:yes gene_type:complete
MQKPSSLGIWCSTNTLNKSQLAILAQTVEDKGYQTLWFPESLSYECFALAGFLLSQSNSLTVASGIANIYARDAVTASQGYDSLNQFYPSRFLLGLGVSHVPLVEDARGHQYGKPVATMQKYLENMRTADIDKSIEVEERSIVLAALGPKMLELAASSAKGALPYCVTPEHTAKARDIMGPDSWLCVEQKICFTDNETDARNIAQFQMERYMMLDNYRNNWLRLGFQEEEITGKGSNRFLDAMVVWGKRNIRNCIEAHFRAGADQVVLQAFKPDGGKGVDPFALDEFSPKK